MLENELTSIEMMIMKCIWDSEEEPGLSQILSSVNERFHKNWKSQTISTYLAHLVKKGFLTMRRQGKVFYYRAEVEEKAYRDCQLRELIEFWAATGTPKEFLESFYHGQGSAEEREELKRLFD